MKLSKIESPAELLKFMDNINYGFVGKNGKIYGDSESDEWGRACLSEWRMLSSGDILKNRYGHCFDQVEIERDWFVEKGYQIKTIFDIFLFPAHQSKGVPCHSFLIYQDKDDKWCWFEHADFLNKGIYKFNTEQEAIKAQLLKYIEFNKNNSGIKDSDIKYLAYFIFDKPALGISHMEYINSIINNNKEHTIKDLG